MTTRKPLFLLVLVFLTACGSFVREQRLSIALLDESYSEQILYGSNQGIFFTDEPLFTVSSGEFPDGLTLYDNGQILGTPTTLGLHQFEIELYDTYNDDDGDEQISKQDTEALELFVTEPSTNDHCPSPDDETITKTYLCVGAGSLDSLAAGESFNLDVNFFVDFAKARDFEFNELTFTIFYDSDHFELDGNDLTDAILRESAYEANAGVSFESEPGELQVRLTSDDGESFRFSGRLLDLPIYAKSDLPANSFTFEVRLDTLTSANSKTELPETQTVNGTVVIEQAVQNL